MDNYHEMIAPSMSHHNALPTHLGPNNFSSLEQAPNRGWNLCFVQSAIFSLLCLPSVSSSFEPISSNSTGLRDFVNELAGRIRNDALSTPSNSNLVKNTIDSECCTFFLYVIHLLQNGADSIDTVSTRSNYTLFHVSPPTHYIIIIELNMRMFHH